MKSVLKSSAGVWSLPPGEKRRLEEKKAKFKEDKASKKSKSQQKRKKDQLLKELKEESSKKKKKKKQEEKKEKKEKPIVTPEDEEEAEVQALLAEVGKSSGQASGSAGSAHRDRWSMADTSKYNGGSSKNSSNQWKGNWDKQSYWEHDQWENYYSSGRGSEQPKSPQKGPKREKEADENEENLEGSPKRPKINFDVPRVAGPLRIDKGRMGPPSSEESQEGDDVGLEGLDPTDDELRESTAHAEAPREGDDEIDPGDGEEGPGQRGQMSCFLLSFGPPSKLPPRRDGPEGSNWCRVDSSWIVVLQTTPFHWVYPQEFQ